MHEMNPKQITLEDTVKLDEYLKEHFPNGCDGLDCEDCVFQTPSCAPDCQICKYLSYQADVYQGWFRRDKRW